MIFSLFHDYLTFSWFSCFPFFPAFAPLLRLSPPPSDKDYYFNLDESEGALDLFDVPLLSMWSEHISLRFPFNSVSNRFTEHTMYFLPCLSANTRILVASLQRVAICFHISVHCWGEHCSGGNSVQCLIENSGDCPRNIQGKWYRLKVLICNDYVSSCYYWKVLCYREHKIYWYALM